jgi:glycosyltransferase involved in cell wall biosynthesis
MKPLVSICVPVFNSEHFIHETILSAINQSYENIEVIITDNNSTDNTWSIINSFNDKRIIKVKNDINYGMNENYRQAFSLAKGEYITFLCGDDVLNKSAIHKQVNLLEKTPDAAFSYGFIEFIGDLSGISGYHYQNVFLPGEFSKLSLTKGRNLAFQVGTVLRKKFLPENPISNLLYFDWLLWLRLGHKHKVTFINEVVGYYRRHANSATLKENKSLYLDDYKNLDLVLLYFRNYYYNNALILFARRKLLNRYIHLSLKNKARITDYIHYLNNFLFNKSTTNST